MFTFCCATRRPSAVSAKLPKQKKVMGSKEEKISELKFCCLLTSRLVYQWSPSEKQSKPATAEPSVASHFCGTAGDQRAGETKGSNRLGNAKEEVREGD